MKKKFWRCFGGGAFVVILALLEIQIAAPTIGYSLDMRKITGAFAVSIIAMLISMIVYPD
jgi:ABC-type sulfate transport system permease component